MLLCHGGPSVETDLFLSVGFNPFIVVEVNVSYIIRQYLAVLLLYTHSNPIYTLPNTVIESDNDCKDNICTGNGFSI